MQKTIAKNKLARFDRGMWSSRKFIDTNSSMFVIFLMAQILNRAQ